MMSPDIDWGIMTLIVGLFITTWAIIFPTLLSLRKELSEFSTKFEVEMSSVEKDIEQMNRAIECLRTDFMKHVQSGG